ncbi:DUF998 domain-containing protein [Streptomyces sp. AC512_CC834]|uniref:DUF998 domain-containing protein n=1 Tax=Streptomyces sp. AC512_CC834 TaxID=2823691 RepID=UPI002665DC35|nr:DUF998 domain-containing protein [Streptomyces sp. AC512_CC834]
MAGPNTLRAPRAATRAKTAGTLLIAGGGVFLAGEFIAATAWTDPPYSYTYHYISNLGVRGPVETLHQVMDSPLSWAMNTGFFLFGILLALGVLTLRGLSGWRRSVSVILGLFMAIGGVLLALNPGDGQEAANQIDYHSIGALASIVSGNVLIVLMGRRHAAIGVSRTVGTSMVALGLIGLIGLPVYLSVAGSEFGLIGLFERVAVYPLLVGQILAGASLWRGRTAAPACSVPAAAQI